MIHPHSYALFETTKPEIASPCHYLLTQPKYEIIASSLSAIPIAIQQLENAQQQGLYLAGYFSYEAGYYIGNTSGPLAYCPHRLHKYLHFIAFNKLEQLDTKSVLRFLEHQLHNKPLLPIGIYNIQLSETQDDYIDQIAKIKAYLCQGETYQVNYTLKAHFKLNGDPIHFYIKLREQQPVEYSALLNFGDEKILSLSPELFVHNQQRMITSKPMKGTARRGLTFEEDKQIIHHMQTDTKIQAEHVMIVDLIRNDFNRICQPRSVKVEHLFQIQTFNTVHQMISTVNGALKPSVSFYNILQALFPCGSVTGAPKIRTMEIIAQLEKHPRGVYTGALGLILPNGDFCFNIPIRTIVVDNNNNAELGIGSGIVFDSHPADEYAECLMKMAFLTNINYSFDLLETFCFDADQRVFIRLAMHLSRLAYSAQTFGFICDLKKIKQHLIKQVVFLTTGRYKIRLALSKGGKLRISHTVLLSNPAILLKSQALTIQVSQFRIDKHSIFQYHKTSYRFLYEKEYRRATEQGYYEVIFLNADEQLVEASRHNLVIKLKGKFYTPPISTGALNGVYRQYLIHSGQVTEQILYLPQLKAAQAIYLINSVSGMTLVALK